MKLFFIAASLFSLTAAGVCEKPGPAHSVAVISNPKLTENSGMDFSKKHQGIFWTHNDANNDAVLFAIGLDGRTRGEFTLEGAENIDWEDISVASCLHDSRRECLYIADVGNNKGKRKEFQVYVVEEPADLSATKLKVSQTITFAAPEKENFESFSVNDSTHDFYLISKWTKKLSERPMVSTLYTLSPGAKSLTTLAILDFPGLRSDLMKDDMIVTSGDFDTSSETFLIGTYGKAYEVALADVKSFTASARVIDMPEMEKSEAISYYNDGGKLSLITSSEGINQPIYSLSCH